MPTWRVCQSLHKGENSRASPWTTLSWSLFSVVTLAKSLKETRSWTNWKRKLFCPYGNDIRLLIGSDTGWQSSFALFYCANTTLLITVYIRTVSSWDMMTAAPSYIYSCSIGHILEHEICHLGCWAGKGKFLKRRNFCLSKQLFEVVFSCFEGQKKNLNFF